MNVIAIDAITGFRQFSDMVRVASDPVVVTDDGEGLLVAMAPDVFERVLFDTDLLARYQDSSSGYY